MVDEQLDALIRWLEAGEAVVVPTDTVYGLCALPGVAGAVQRIFDLKGRAADTPIAVLCADADQAFGLAADVGPAHRSVAAACWPGPLTLVLRRRHGLRWPLGAPPDTIGVRCPDHGLIVELASRLGPIAATSANRHGEPPATLADDARRRLGSDVRVVDGGQLGTVASTVVDAVDVPWQILRDGGVSAGSLRAAGAPLDHPVV